MDYGTRKNATTEDKIAAESVIQRVYLSVEELCIGKGDVRQRLKDAVLILLPLQTRDFPACLQKDFEWVIKESSKYESHHPKFRGNLDETMRRIRNTTGQKIAQRILSIYSTLQDIRGFPLLEYRNHDDS